MNGVFSLMLHAHIPYCRKSGVWPAGEEWLFEAMNETYIPLLSVLRKMQRKNLKPNIMIGVVPVLAEQLADPYMNNRFSEYMEDKIQRAAEDYARFQDNEKKREVAKFWFEKYQNVFSAYCNHFFRDIIGTLKWLQEEGVIEVITSAATHGFLPLMDRDSTVYSQIHCGVKTYEKHFGTSPSGFWLPECAYRGKREGKSGEEPRRALDEWLADEGIKYFFVENIGIENAEFIENKYNEDQPTTYRGYKLESGVCVFGRNRDTGKQVWSAKYGYPGDQWYREFHQKDPRSGLHYNRITNNDEKAIYEPSKASERVESHAGHFTSLINDKLAGQQAITGSTPPVIVSPYDCELFGHWWLEGVDWINSVYDILFEQEQVQTVSLSDYIDQYKSTFSVIRMRKSSWGENGDFTVWTNPEHAWLWPYVNQSSKEFEEVLQLIEDTGRTYLNERDMRILKQTARELLLLEGSDWPFLLHTRQAKEYANKRFHHHHQRFNKLIWAAKNLDEEHRLSMEELNQMEDLDNPWPDIDHHWFKKR